MKSLGILLTVSTILMGCDSGSDSGACSTLQCEENPEAVYLEEAMEKICEQYQQCYSDFDCSELVGFDDSLAWCDFDIEQAQACLDGEYSCNLSVEYEAIVLPEACGEAFRCTAG